ncbi:FAD-dependent oxidoreductase [Streptomyces radicis]|uniref:FAD-dependent oxidoreductase n=1 Tax=Streptomyces radicis TaxID=1750517 RepID=A0A3A9VZY7_9ACTN|nr:FAD-dependent oxidoreductase [Streptomyces radicis]RKN06270.1 FAD-dependent oxidoreductase [Streptomyces radicis]RKN18600.1 FAD-dependent oxidoreductase [Streptomyces radicis]
MNERPFDLAVVGAGPAGLAAAVAAGESGLRVALVDAGPRPGGQFWRHAEGADGAGHHDWETFASLRSRLRRLTAGTRVRHLPLHQVWAVDRAGDAPFTLRLTPAFDGATDEVTPAVRARAIALCTGGYDRQLPVPGWTLPGVMAAGGVQALLKGSGTVAGRRAVVAGTGPFLLPVATGLAAAGAEVAAVVEAARPADWLRRPLGAAAVPGKAVEGAGYAAALLRHRVPYLTRSAVTRVHGGDEVTAVTVERVDGSGRVVPGRTRRLAVDLVAFGWGFTPSLELVVALGAGTERGADGSLVATVDRARRATVPGVYVAGEATGVGGAAKAVAEGELAGLTAAVDAGRPAPTKRGRRLAARIARAERFAEAMHAAHPVPERWTEWLTEATVLCRCEEVTVGAVERAREDLGAGDPRTAKLLARPGMGWCQGRVCGFATAALLAAGAGRAVTAEDLRALGKRPLAAPVTLGELAALPEPPDPPDFPDPDTA